MCWNHVRVSSTYRLPAAIWLWRNDLTLLNIVSLSNFNWTNIQNECTSLCFVTHWCRNCISASRKRPRKDILHVQTSYHPVFNQKTRIYQHLVHRMSANCESIHNLTELRLMHSNSLFSVTNKACNSNIYPEDKKCSHTGKSWSQRVWYFCHLPNKLIEKIKINPLISC